MVPSILMADSERRGRMTVRNDILAGSPFFKLVAERYPRYESDPDALGMAIEGHFRGIPELSAIDGFNTFHVLDESPTRMRVIGLAWFLPSSLIPLEASFQASDSDISYSVMLGAEDPFWQSLRERKRWSAVYLYATENLGPPWNWGKTLQGSLPNLPISS